MNIKLEGVTTRASKRKGDKEPVYFVIKNGEGRDMIDLCDSSDDEDEDEGKWEDKRGQKVGYLNSGKKEKKAGAADQGLKSKVEEENAEEEGDRAIGANKERSEKEKCNAQMKTEESRKKRRVPHILENQLRAITQKGTVGKVGSKRRENGEE